MASKYFEIPVDTSGQVKAKCKLCGTFISGSTKTTSNFSTHLKRKHRDEYLAINNSQPSSTQNPQPSMANFLTKSKQFTSTDPNQRQITDSLIQFIAGDLVPLSVVNSDNFRALINQLEPRYQMPDRKTLSTTILHKKYEEVQSNLKQQLQRAESVALTIDLWSNRQMKGFLGVTGHYLLNWTLKSVVIACKRFKGKHCAENINLEYEQCIATFDIADKITHIITDNASNMVKAFDFSIPGYVESQITTNDGDAENSDSESDDPSDLEQYFFDNDETDVFSVDCNERISKHKRCYAHTLQLVIRDGFKEANQGLRNIIGKVSTIASFARRSLKATEILEGEKRIQSANLTRWNSQLIMIRSVLSIPAHKLDSLDTTKLTVYERKLLQELCSILTPFEQATTIVQKENHVSASLAIPATMKLKEALDSLSVSYNIRLVTALRTSINKRMSIYENDEVFQLSAVLDPRFKLDWFDSETESAITEKLTKKCSKIFEQAGECDIGTEVSSPPSKLHKCDRPEDLFFTTPRKNRKRHPSSKDTEVKTYLNEPCEDITINPLKFWLLNEPRLPLLAKVAAKYLGIPVTSAPVERLFSVAGKIFRPERCRLNDETFEKLMMIKCNSKQM